MKYKCDMVRDLLPLCNDKSATKDSEQVVLEHLAECKGCMEYYHLLNKDILVDGSIKESEKKYSVLARKIRKRNIIVRLLIVLLLWSTFALSINYAVGYRMNPLSAASTSTRLNYKSELLGSYEWNDWRFYIYDSYSCYDVVPVKKTWHGWGVSDTILNWPKWFGDDIGIEMAGGLYHWSYDEGVQLFPFIVRDDNVKTVEVTIFGETKSVEVKADEFNLVTFEIAGVAITNNATARAFDNGGNILYTLEDQYGYWVWKPVE